MTDLARAYGFACFACRMPAFYLKEAPAKGKRIYACSLFALPTLRAAPSLTVCQHCDKDPRWPDGRGGRTAYPAAAVEQYEFPGGVPTKVEAPEQPDQTTDEEERYP